MISHLCRVICNYGQSILEGVVNSISAEAANQFEEHKIQSSSKFPAMHASQAGKFVLSNCCEVGR